MFELSNLVSIYFFLLSVWLAGLWLWIFFALLSSLYAFVFIFCFLFCFLENKVRGKRCKILLFTIIFLFN